MSDTKLSATYEKLPEAPSSATTTLPWLTPTPRLPEATSAALTKLAEMDNASEDDVHEEMQYAQQGIPNYIIESMLEKPAAPAESTPAPTTAPAAVATPPVVPAPEAPKTSSVSPEVEAMMRTMAEQSKVMAELLATLKPQPPAPPAPAPTVPQVISREELIKNPYRALVAAGIDPKSFESTVKLAAEDAPQDLRYDQRFRDIEQRFSEVEQQAASRVKELEYQLALERARVDVEARAKAIPENYQTLRLAAENAPDDVQGVLLYKVVQEGKTPEQAMQELDAEWSKFSKMFQPRPALAPAATPAPTPTPSNAAPPAPVVPAVPKATDAPVKPWLQRSIEEEMSRKALVHLNQVLRR